jgi:protein gp37
MGKATYGEVITGKCWNGETAFVPSAMDKPYGWKTSRSVFICSMGDMFHNSVPFAWVERILGMVASNPQHTFIVLTKRARRMQEFFQATDMTGQLACLYQLAAGTNPETCQKDNWPLPNLVLGVSAENQATADERIHTLLQIPAAKRFVSIEPMLEGVDLYRGGWSFLNALVPPPGNKTGWKRGLDGVVVGGESGNKARLLNPQWVRLVRDQCEAAGVPFMFKQWGNNVLQENGRPWEYNFPNGFPDLDGKEHSKLAW